MDRTPIQFIFDDGKAYNTSGEKDVSTSSGQSEFDKRQYTAQLIVFGDGVPRLKPLIIFRGKDLRIKKEEKQKWDKGVRVVFQENAWCDETVMLDWIKTDWGNFFTNPSTSGSDGKILIVDIHRAQQTDDVKTFLGRCKTNLVNIPGGLTPYLDVLEVPRSSRCGSQKTVQGLLNFAI